MRCLHADSFCRNSITRRGETWEKLQPMIKSYVANLTHLLMHVTGKNILRPSHFIALTRPKKLQHAHLPLCSVETHTRHHTHTPRVTKVTKSKEIYHRTHTGAQYTRKTKTNAHMHILHQQTPYNSFDKRMLSCTPLNICTNHEYKYTNMSNF